VVEDDESSVVSEVDIATELRAASARLASR
jgi:hypothetical protein